MAQVAAAQTTHVYHSVLVVCLDSVTAHPNRGDLRNKLKMQSTHWLLLHHLIHHSQAYHPHQNQSLCFAIHLSFRKTRHCHPVFQDRFRTPNRYCGDRKNAYPDSNPCSGTGSRNAANHRRVPQSLRQQALCWIALLNLLLARPSDDVGDCCKANSDQGQD